MKLKITCLLFISLLFICFTHVLAQPLSKKTVFTHADTLRGSNGPGRNWWDVTKYDLHVKFNIEDSTISGFNNIAFKVLNSGEKIQVDLQEPLLIDSIYLSYSITKGTGRSEKIEKFTREGNAYFIRDMHLDRGTHGVLTVYYHGKPTIAVRPPWDGGLIWTKDKSNSPWVSIACQGLGASVWYPCKDIQSDEPDSAEMHITCPDTLVCVGNGRLRGKIINGDGTATYDWAVVNPINNYCIIPYIGKYVHFGEIFKGEKGDLTMDYWVLDSNLDKAKKQFQDAPRMMKTFEYWFGPYPFYEDGYKLVDAPHLGMEHQSATAYGNGYQNGYHGTDLSGSGWGLKWDFIIVHESGHEWFGNNITSKDLADMWIHESFTNYSETLFTEYYYGKAAADAYVIGTRKRIVNDVPTIAPYGVNKEGSGDMYYKGGNMLHTIRQAINNDDLFRNILRGLNKIFYHQTVTTKQIENYISTQSKIDFSKVFDQYLRTTQIPVLEYKQNGYQLQYRYTNCVAGFKLPLKIIFKGQRWIKPSEVWQTLNLYPEGDNTFSVDPNFYINTKKVD
ncbi:M1 family metallopeptidase [Ferruginibacter sp.]|uniref:M1 family metallopeptidase n=1 Tax=Ferruginibacter sp. TaxID=1940288 RepID=UPI0026583BA3|nr:M1 family metallopeptidase [Ferruginibacter sp.]